MTVRSDPKLDPEAVWRSWHGPAAILVVAGTTEQPHRFSARWYSRHGEIELCGSGAVALAGLLLDDTKPDCGVFQFAGRFHDVLAKRIEHGVKVRLPNVALEHVSPGLALLQALQLDQWTEALVSKPARTYVIRLRDGVDLRGVVPDFASLQSLDLPDLAAVIITSLRPERRAFTFRYFTPWHGLNESPAAASAHSLLGDFWMMRTGERALTSIQQSTAEPHYEIEVDTEGTWVAGQYTIGGSHASDAIPSRGGAPGSGV